MAERAPWAPFRRIVASPALRESLVAFVTVRLLGSLVAAIGLAGIPSLPMPAALGYLPAPGGPLYNATIGLWARWDAAWWLRVAELGYSPGNQGATFFPLFPLAIRALHALGLPSLPAALLVSNGCFVAGLFFVHRLADMDLGGPEVARRAVWFQALYPGCVFCLAPYSEAPFLALAAGTFFAARTRRWWLVGLLGAAASATRIVGVLLVAPLAVELAQQWRESSPRPPLRAAMALPAVPLGLAAFMLYWQRTCGRPLEFLAQLQAWGRVPMAPWTTLRLGLAQATADFDRYPHAVYLLEAGAILGLLAVAVGGLRVLRPAYSVFLWLGVAPLLLNPAPIRIFCSLLRYSAVLFPAALVMAAVVRRPSTNEGIRLIFAGLFALCTALFVTSQWML